MIEAPQDLDSCFLEPPGLHWDSFVRDGRDIRYSYVFPSQSAPKALIVILPGLSEFIEKYFETIQNLLDQSYAVAILDWMGQGESGRYFENNPHKRGTSGFQDDGLDLHFFITQKLAPVLAHRNGGTDSSLPLIMLGHSMGGHIGLHYLAQHQDIFACAVFSAPMLGINGISPGMIHLSSFLNMTAGSFYAFGQQDWSHILRANAGGDQFSGDPVRGAVHNSWCLHNESLQTGGVTFGWVHEALHSCADLQTKLHSIHTPCLLALAAHECIVDNTAIRQGADLLPHSSIIELPNAKHEILMDRDDIRNLFLKSFYGFAKKHII